MKKKELRALKNLITTKWVQSENARTHLQKELDQVTEEYDKLIEGRLSSKPFICDQEGRPSYLALRTEKDELRQEIKDLKDRTFQLMKRRDDLQQELKASDRQNSILREQLDNTPSQSQKEDQLSADVKQLIEELNRARATIEKQKAELTKRYFTDYLS